MNVHIVDSEHQEGIQGDARFGPQMVTLRYADGKERQLRYEGAQAMLGGTKDNTIVLTLMGNGQHYVRLYIQDRQLTDHLDPHMPAPLRDKLARLSRKKSWAPTKPLIIAGSLALTAVGIWLGTLWAFDRAVDAVPPDWEIKFGKLVGQGMVNENPVQDPLITKPVQELAARLVKVLPREQPYPFTFHVIHEKSPNAFALPGGTVIITSGLLAEAQSPDEIAGIVGHELQHVLGRHTFRRMAKEMGMSLLFALVFGDTASILVEGGQELIGLQFDRNQELESDRVGLRLAHQAGFKATALGDFFSRQQKKTPSLDHKTEAVLSYLSTHPAHGDRLKQIADIAQDLPPQTIKAKPIEGWRTMQQHAKALR